MGIGDVVGGLLIYDSIQEWRAERQFSRQLSANMDRAQAEYVTWRRARPADIRALLPLEFAYRVAIRPVMDSFDDYSKLAEELATEDDSLRDMFLDGQVKWFSCLSDCLSTPQHVVSGNGRQETGRLPANPRGVPPPLPR